MFAKFITLSGKRLYGIRWRRKSNIEDVRYRKVNIVFGYIAATV